MNSKDIKRIHMEEQWWRRIQDYRSDIARIALFGSDPKDEDVIRMVCGYIMDGHMTVPGDYRFDIAGIALFGSDPKDEDVIRMVCGCIMEHMTMLEAV